MCDRLVDGRDEGCAADVLALDADPAVALAGTEALFSEKLVAVIGIEGARRLRCGSRDGQHRQVVGKENPGDILPCGRQVEVDPELFLISKKTPCKRFG